MIENNLKDKNLIEVKTIIDEDFNNYKVPSMFIGFPHCSFKCDKEYGTSICQNSELVLGDSEFYTAAAIVDRYMSNWITAALVIGGLEPFDDVRSLKRLVTEIRTRTDDDIVIYTGYTEDELATTTWNWNYKNIIIKYGRYIPNKESHFDSLLKVKLASPNQYAKKLNNAQVILNPDGEQLDFINERLAYNKENYGQPYCPCVLPMAFNKDTVCPCTEFKKQESGSCHCAKYIKIKK